MCCDIDGLFAHIGEMNRIELAKAYLVALQENANLRRQIQNQKGASDGENLNVR